MLLSGFAFDACAHAMGFAPRLPLPFAAPFGFAGAFGQVRLEEGGALLRVAEGTLPLRTLTLPQACIPASPVVLADDVPVPVMAEGNVLHLPDLRIARTLEVRSHC